MKGVQWLVANLAGIMPVEKFVFGRGYRKLQRIGCAEVARPYWLVDDNRAVAYLVNAKVACSSISVSMTGMKFADNDSIHFSNDLNGLRRVWGTLSEAECGYWKFTFVRNPYARVFSAYENKVHTKDKAKQGYFNSPLDGYLAKDRGFADFVRKVVRIPIPLLDPHLCSQYHLIYRDDGKPIVDSIGRFENLSQEYETVRQRFGFEPLPHYNRSANSGRWREAYTPELAELVYEKYHDDFEAFGYARTIQS